MTILLRIFFIASGETQGNVFKTTKNVECSHIIGSNNDSQAGFSHELDHLPSQTTYIC